MLMGLNIRRLKVALRQTCDMCVIVYLSNCVVDNFLGRQITLVADEQPINMLAGITLDLLQPLLYVVERFLFKNIANTNAIKKVVMKQQKTSVILPNRIKGHTVLTNIHFSTEFVVISYSSWNNHNYS